MSTEKPKRELSPNSLANLKHWQPGQSGNPAGRPKNTLSDAYRDILQQKFPGDAQGRTYAELIALGQAREAIKGKTQAAAEIADRTEGKPRQSVELTGPEGGAIPVSIEDLDRRIASLLERGGYIKPASGDEGGAGAASGVSEPAGGEE